MKNWFKTYQTPEMDIIARKGFDEIEGKAEIHIIVHLTDHGLEANAKLGFPSVQKREDIFEEMAMKIIKPIINFILNIIGQ